MPNMFITSYFSIIFTCALSLLAIFKYYIILCALFGKPALHKELSEANEFSNVNEE
jgi:hypothetical protein